MDDLLDVSRITRGKIELRRELLDAARSLENACEPVSPLVAEAGHTLLATIPRDQLWVEADPTRLEQIAVNLLANAARYTEPRGRIWLEARREKTRSSSRCAIRDRDRPGRYLQRCSSFSPRASVLRPAWSGGLGIGLTVVRGLCEMHGGSVSAHSRGPGTGSTFIDAFTSRGDAGIAALPRDPSRTLAEGAGRCVLVVDDNADAAQRTGAAIDAARL